MIFKKALISLSILGTVGGAGAGVYYLKNQNNNQEVTTRQQEHLPTTEAGKGLSVEAANQVNGQNPSPPLPSVEGTPPPTPPKEVPERSLELTAPAILIDTTNSLVQQETQKTTTGTSGTEG